MELKDARVGDRIEVTDIYEGEVTFVANGIVTIGNRYSLSVGYGSDDDPVGLIRERNTKMIKPSIPDVLPVGSVVRYNKIFRDNMKFYVQTETGWQDLDLVSSSGDDPTALANDVRAGRAELRFMPKEA